MSNIKNFCLVTVAASALLSAVTPAWAQDAAGDTQIEEVVVTARKIEENVQDIPVAVTALSGANLVRQNVRELRDLASKAPGLSFSQGGSSPSSQNVSLRGQTQPDNVLTTDGAVALYVDNVVLPRSYGLRANMVDVARIEVLRGPQGTLYGKNTTGGLVNIITNDPTQAFGGSLKGVWGNHDTWNFTGVVNVPIDDNMGLRLVAQRGHHGPYGHDKNGVGLAFEDTSFLRAKFRGEWGPLTVGAFASYNSTATSGVYELVGLIPATATAPEGGTLTREAAAELFGASNATTWALALPIVRSYVGGDPYVTGGVSPSHEDNYARDVGLDIGYQLTDDIKVRSITGYRSLGFGGIIEEDGTPFIGLHPRRAAQDDFISQELQLLGGDETLNWVAGGYANWEHGKEFSTTSTAPYVLTPTRLTQVNVTNGKVTSESYAVFGQFNWKFAPRLSATLGGRYTYDKRGLISFNQSMFNGATFSCSVPVVLRADPAVCRGVFSKTFKEPTWTASLTYAATDDISAYAKASHGFRSGGQNYRGSTTVESFAPFKPETVNEYELGLKTELFDRSIRLNIAAFYDEISDVQRSVIIQASTGATSTVQTNAASATVKGLEVEGTWRVTSAFTIDGSLSVIDPKYDSFRDFTGDRSGEDWPTPKVQGNVAATYVADTPVGSLSSTVGWSYQGRKNLASASKNKAQVTQKAYGLLNARIALDLAEQDVSVALYGRNLTDKAFFTGAVGLESLGFNVAQTGEPRTYGIEVTKRFGAH